MYKSKRAKAISGTGGAGKTAVMGLLERHSEKKCSQVRAKVIPNTKRDTLHDVIRSHVEPGTAVYNDASAAYRNPGPEFVNGFVDHAESYVNGAVHTNGLENFGALFKRCIKGTRVSVEPFHLFRYVDAKSFRLNSRESTDSVRFVEVLRGVEGKRLTYKNLIGEVQTVPAAGCGKGSTAKRQA
jgi:hypothetical protein